MILPPPFFGFPNHMNYRQPYGYSKFKEHSFYNKNFNVKNNVCNNSMPNQSLNMYNKTTNKCTNDYGAVHKEETSSSCEDRTFFEIMGIKLYFDDILLICLIFFLYSEGVQDEMLFVALVLLLLS